MSIAAAWDSHRPIYSRLPGVNGRYSESDLADTLTHYWDELLLDTRKLLDDVGERQIDVLRCDPDWLDFLAPLHGWDKDHWNSLWPVAGKRQLLSNSHKGEKIWQNKGTGRILSFVLTSVGLQNKVIEDSDFIIGTSTVGEDIGTDPWSYTVYLPSEYRHTAKEREAYRIDALFSPAYCECIVIFDPEMFQVYEYLTDFDATPITTETDELLLNE